ncbi:hypothetical protein [Brachyspira aalborgi]|uniref:Uncharacterized protein n=1 Tax=Brachyspira aalborgi TaxID=29522 RepID=A0A5C8CDS8_9SPIR|nr:hypothetical protein [Brachyspira aalborgi]TXJ11599.1 hypothetical protein EPJ80_07720 [Brachyspira aalborgi]
MKRELGQYFTTYNPFQNSGFLNWAYECDLSKTTILEPFAGSNNLINMLQDMGLCADFKSFDIEPKNKFVKRRDTLKNFPKGFKVCITNPPYLAQNSAKRRNLEFPNIIYDDLYKYSLENCDYVGTIIPASFFNANIFRERLSHYILLNSKMFNDTEHPVCLALFKKYSEDVDLYNDNKYLGKLSDLNKKLPKSNINMDIRFNVPNGNLGLIAIDNTIEPSIKFVNGEEISPERIRVSSRSITRIMIPTKYKINSIIEKLNYNLNIFRKETYDLFLTPFKGLRKDNYYRRRLDYKLAKKLIEETLYGI